MSLWENVWSQVKAEMPQAQSRPRSWGGFLGALFAAALIIAVWFPIRLIFEILKSFDFSEKPDHTTEAQDLFRQAYALSLDLPSQSDFAYSVVRHVELPPALHDVFSTAIAALYAQNMMLDVPAIPADLNNLEGIRWRDKMRREIVRMSADHLVKMRRACLSSIENAKALLPAFDDNSTITSPLASLVPTGKFVEALVKPLNANLFPTFVETFTDNTYRISGVARGAPIKPSKLAEPHHLDDPSPFLDNTPFATILSTPISIAIPQALRFSHHWIVAGSGAGKTNALQYLISEDLERAARGECSLIVLDSQHQLIETLASLKLFAPGQPLQGKLCLLDAADVDFPIAVNLFDMKLGRIASLSSVEQERLMNSALEMYDFIIGSLLQAEMTSRQSTLFRFVTRALFAIEGASIHTFHDILQNGVKKYQSAIDSLDETSKLFFASDFNNPQFRQTKEQVVARLWAVMGNRTFLRMFSSKNSKVDFFEEINTPGKVILINAEKGLLKEEGTELFGRFFLALINQAAAQRSTLPKHSRLPCYVYVDECHNYIRNDPKIQVILAEARQQNVGVILAHQYLAQIEPPVLRALGANTSIKMAARLEGSDRSAMARDMNTVPDFIRDQPLGSFASFMRGATPSAISMHFPLDALRQFERMTARERTDVLAANRATYANPVSSAQQQSRQQSDKKSDTDSDSHRRDPDS